MVRTCRKRCAGQWRAFNETVIDSYFSRIRLRPACQRVTNVLPPLTPPPHTHTAAGMFGADIASLLSARLQIRRIACKRLVQTILYARLLLRNSAFNQTSTARHFSLDVNYCRMLKATDS